MVETSPEQSFPVIWEDTGNNCSKKIDLWDCSSLDAISFKYSADADGPLPIVQMFTLFFSDVEILFSFSKLLDGQPPLKTIKTSGTPWIKKKEKNENIT